MTFVVTDACINCKYTDCVSVCPTECFHEGENMLVINPVNCIDCGICEPECPADAIRSDREPGMEPWAALNEKYAAIWPVLTEWKAPPSDADEWDGQPDKLKHFSTAPGA